jgi:hypothetical protein
MSPSTISRNRVSHSFTPSSSVISLLFAPIDVSFGTIGSCSTANRMLGRGALKLHSPEQKKWLIVDSCHAGLLGDNRTPVDSDAIFYAPFKYYYNRCSFTLDLFLSTHALQ